MSDTTTTRTDEDTDEEAADATDAADAADATGEAPADDGDAGGVAGDDHLELAEPPPSEEPIKDRLLIPALLPFLCMIAVALYTLNVSRVFLAGDSTSALGIAAGITVAILAGGAIVSASPRLRTSSLAMFLGLVLVIIVSAGLLSLGPSLSSGESATGGPLKQPAGAAASSVAVTAEPNITFNASDYTAQAGVVEIDYGGAAGHTLQFRTLDYQGFPLHSSSSAGPTKGKVTLKPGTYQIYCTVPGHAATMHATITVS
jgi:plastocyanin